MSRFKLIAIYLLLIPAFIFSQKKNFTVEDVIINAYSKLMPENLRQLQWIPDGSYFSFVKDNFIIRGSVESEKYDTVVSLDNINALLSGKSIDRINYLPSVSWINENEFNFIYDNKLIRVNTAANSAEVINSAPEEAENLTIAPNNRYLAFTVKNNLYVSLDGKEYKAITNEQDSNIICGQSVHRNEFGINGGIFWSPNSDFIAFYRMDQTMVTDFPLLDISYKPARVKNIKYPMAGQASHHVTVGIYRLNDESITWLNTGEPKDQYLTSLTWSPDQKNFFIAHLNRDQNHLQLIKYDVSSGEAVKTLFEEKNDKYVEPETPLYFIPGSPNKFVWLSERDGYKHAYLYDTDGNLIKQLTKGEWVITDFDGFDKDGKFLFFTATKESPLERHYYRLELKSAKLEKITGEPGSHYVLHSDDGVYFIDNYSNYDTPRKILLTDSKKSLRNLLTADNPLSGYNLGKTEVFSIKNKEGVDLYCRMILPPDFDPAKKYPVIFYVYGGPHAQLVTNSFGYGRYFIWFYLMAQKGYIVFTLDNRGSDNRGLEFEQATFRRLGTVEIEDQLCGVEYLKKLSYVDTSRFGVFGWSYGGFMAASLMLRTGNQFKVGVGGGAVIDWSLYEVMYTERYMDTPETNPEGYKESSLLNYVENLNGKLLLVHGTFDPVVVWQHTLLFAEKAMHLNKPLDYFPYLKHEHGVRGRDALHLYTKITGYFVDNL
ncbi:DPP IV N-terminal domain-containing protein [Melioribacter sp. Ez-97]|uniref:S9 family peptidase n=1 Tax=Melioribacter sp. Ez-97 TaxID=3423434 RepID=UPI003EDAC534